VWRRTQSGMFCTVGVGSLRLRSWASARTAALTWNHESTYRPSTDDQNFLNHTGRSASHWRRDGAACAVAAGGSARTGYTALIPK